MKVSQVSITTVLGLKQLTFQAGKKLTEIRGRNGSGKTSALEALKAALGQGSIANLATVGAEGPPEVVLAFDDQTRTRVRGKTREVEVPVDTSAGTVYAAVKKPQAHLAGLYDTALANPVAFLLAPPTERAEMLLGALPLECDWAVLWEALPPEGRAALEGVNTKLHPLEVLGTVRQRVFELRTSVNVKQKEKASSATSLRGSLPADAGKDWAAEAAAIAAKHEALTESVRGRIVAIGMKEQEVIRGIIDATRAEKDRVKATAAESIERIRAAAETQIAEVRTAQDASIAEIEKRDIEAQMAAADVRCAAEKEVAGDRAQIEALAVELATARTKASESVRVATTRDLAEQYAREAEGLKAKGEELTAALATVDETKAALAKSLPIAGLEIVGKEITVHGIGFDSLNTAQKIRIAVEIATLRSKDQKLRVVFLDGLEALDTEGQRELFAALEAADVQAFVTRVTDEPFTIVADGELVHAGA